MILNDVCNASPSSMAAGAGAPATCPASAISLSWGDMLELGAESEAGLRETGVAAAWVDLLIAVGERAREIAAGAATAGLPGSGSTCAPTQRPALSLARAREAGRRHADEGLRGECNWRSLSRGLSPPR